MFGQKELDEDGNNVSALLEPGCQFEGKLTFKDTVRINGHFTGEIFSEGTLVVGEGAVVDAHIDVGSIIIKGKVNGEIDASERIEMKVPAEVRGDIRARTLVIEEGVLFEGKCRMGEARIVREAEEPANSLTSGNGNDGEGSYEEGSPIL